LSAQVDRERMKYDYLAAFTKVDVLLGPTSPLPAPKIGQDRAVLGGQDHDLLMAVVCCTGPSNLTGMPAMSVPAGFSREGLPVGVQLIGPYFDEARLLRVAKVLEDALASERNRKPQL
jgi:aspartyl-tRNA(Asn)/glutamyl-tRNA(Gln) amidotransferase subunit A